MRRNRSHPTDSFESPAAEDIIHISAANSTISLKDPDSNVFGTGDSSTIRLQGAKSTVTIGNSNGHGNLALFPNTSLFTNIDDLSTATVQVSGGLNSFIQLRNFNKNSNTAENSVFIGGKDSTILLGQTLRLEGDDGRIVSQSLQLRSSDGGNSIHLSGNDSTMLLGDTLRLEGNEGRIVTQNLQVRSSNGDNSIHLGGNSSTILLGKTLRLDGKAGDIILENADCAEDFDVELLEAAEPGTVMVISDDSRLRVSDQAYDHRVAGIVAGAGKYRPGIVLGRKKGEANQIPIALMGRVYCKVDADQGSIKVGDLLTTSSIPGHAMKVNHPSNAFGAVIGKALAPLEKGQSMIPVLVALQ